MTQHISHRAPLTGSRFSGLSDALARNAGTHLSPVQRSEANDGRIFRDTGSQARATAHAPKATPAPKPKATNMGPSEEFYATQRAIASALDKERGRMSAVLLSPDSQGKQQSAAKLLTRCPNASAAQIVSLLRTDVATDAERERMAGRAKQQQIDAVWSRVYAKVAV